MAEKNLQEVYKELQEDILHPELIKNNKICFPYADSIYRVCMPNQREIAEANEYRNKLYIKLIQSDNTLTKKKLVKILKEKQDIDIESMEKEADKLEKELLQKYISLAKTKDGSKKRIKRLEEEIEEIKQKRMDIILEKSGFLAPCIEIQVEDSFYKYLTAKCTQKYIANEEEEKESEWKRVWKSFEDYEKDDSKLPYLALGKLTNLIVE